MMCKTVCLRGILGNTGNCRKQWVAHKWYPGDDVNEWFNYNENYIEDIQLAGGAPVSDNEKVQNLVDSFPEDILTKAIPEVDRFKQSEPGYPTYTHSKRMITTTVSKLQSDYEMSNLNEERNPRALIIRKGRRNERNTHNTPTDNRRSRDGNRSTDTRQTRDGKPPGPCNHCGNPDHWIRDCPDKPASKRGKYDKCSIWVKQTILNPNVYLIPRTRTALKT
jgi:hypothetical protein